ncbi:MAG: MarR family transcriptional regulator [Chloroflexi bacterium]|nr:MarR family transcriptional regulator [Chloroflexota bacterium]MDA1271544.1 MarR family transcriptional regulator [Chloroflexota bacterium]
MTSADDRKKQQYLQMWRSFLKTHSTVVKHLERRMQEQHGLPLAWWDVLVQLAEGPESGLRMGELAEAVLLTRSGITRLVDRMIGEGLVVREQCPRDRRGYYAVISQKGLDIMAQVGPDHSENAWEVFLGHISEEEAVMVERVFSRVLAAAK